MMRTKLTSLGFAALCIGMPLAALAQNPEAAEAEAFKKMDTNGDGKISADEHAAAAKKMFDLADANHDGKLSPEELSAAHEKMHPGKKATGHPDEQTAAEKLKAMDTNGDGAISADEWAAGSKARFDKLDTDHDGSLNKTEWMAGHKAMMEKKGTTGTTPTTPAPKK